MSVSRESTVPMYDMPRAIPAIKARIVVRAGVWLDLMTSPAVRKFIADLFGNDLRDPAIDNGSCRAGGGDGADAPRALLIKICGVEAGRAVTRPSFWRTGSGRGCDNRCPCN